MLILDPMNDEEFEQFLAWNTEEYARERMIPYHQTFEESLATVKSMLIKIIAEGRSSPNHHFFKLLEETSHRRIGSVWFHLRPESNDVYLYNIEIDSEERRKGYGQQAMATIESFAKSKGARVMWLNVFGHNTGARRLYSNSGYKEVAVQMSKNL